MKTIINILIITLSLSPVYAQKSFNYFDIGNKDNALSITESNSGKLFVAGILDMAPNQQKEGVVLRLNSDGELEAYRNYFSDYNCSYVSDIVNDPNTGNLFIVGETLSHEVLIMELDEELDVVASINIPCPADLTVPNVELLLEDSSIIAYGMLGLGFKNKEYSFVNDLNFDQYLFDKSDTKSYALYPFFAKVNKELTDVIEFNYLELESFSTCNQLLLSPNMGNYYAFIGAFPINYVGCNTNRALTLLELNPAFEIVDTIGVVSEGILSVYSAVDFNNTILFAGFISHYYINIAPYSKDAYNILVKQLPYENTHCIDSCFIGPIGMDSVSMPALFQAVCKNDDLGYVAGTDNFAWGANYTHGYETSAITLHCFNQDFDKEWERFYGEDDTYFLASYITPLAAGGVAIAGLKHDLSDTGDDTEFMVLIVDKEGHLTSENTPFVEKSTLCFPSPATSEINIRVAIQHKNCTIELYNMSGALLKTEKANSGITTLDISAFPSGNYIYKVYNGAGFVESGKFFKCL